MMFNLQGDHKLLPEHLASGQTLTLGRCNTPRSEAIREAGESMLESTLLAPSIQEIGAKFSNREKKQAFFFQKKEKFLNTRPLLTDPPSQSRHAELESSWHG